MSGSERWKIMIENGRLCVEENGRYFEDIDNVGTTREFGIIKVTYESGKAKMYSLKNLCEGLGFGPAVKTRSGFMKIWNSLKANVDNYQLQTSSTDNIDQPENQVNMNISDVPGGEDLTSTDDNVNTLDNVQRKSSTQKSPVQKKLLSPMDSSEDASTVEDILGRSVGSCTEAHINTEDASDSTPVTVEQSILDDYLIGDALKVHIQNLVIPADDRCFRNLDTKHAHCLKQFYENQQMCHTILIGNIVSDVTTDKGNLSKFLQEPGKVAVETLGGNHTRHALQCLFASQTKPISMVTCRLYNKLPDELALQLGYEHNASNTLGKPTSFVDLVKMFRKEATKIVGDTDISCMQSSEVKQWKDIICTILGMDRKAEEFHNKYKIVLKIAKSKDSVWRKFLEFCSAFEMNEIRNTPRGSLKITQLRDFSMLSSDNQIHILEETLQTKDWRVFKREVESVSSDRKKTIGKTKAGPSDVDRKINENECKIKQLTAEREKLATTSSTLKSKLTEEQKKTEDFETLLNQERKKCSALEIKLQQLRRSENELKVVLDKQIDKNEKSSNLLQVEKTKYQTLEEMYNKLDEAKACLEKKVQEFEESSRCQHIEKHKSQVDNSIVSGRDFTPKQKLKNDCSHSDNLNKKKRRMSSKEFEVGTSVEAFWYPDKCWYTAKILMKTGKDCPIGTFSEAGENCKECPIGFYGNNCFAGCICRDNERCDNKHGCVESTTTYNFSTISKGKEEEGSVVLYFGGVGLLVIGFLIGMLLGLKHKCYYQKRASEEKDDEMIQSPAGEPIEMDSYEYIDEQNMTDQNQFTVPPSLPALKKSVQHLHNEASINDYTYSIDGQKGNRIEDKGVLNPYEPIQRENIYRREYKVIGDAIKTNKQADECLHPYNSLLKNGFSEGHEYKDLSNTISKPELNSSESNECQSSV